MSSNCVGAWRVAISLPSLGMQSKVLMTFFSDGNLNTDEIPIPFETSGHGSWIESGAQQAAYTFYFLVGDSQQGKWQEGNVSGRLELGPSGDSWEGPFEITMVDQDGKQTFANTGIMAGTRIRAAV